MFLKKRIFNKKNNFLFLSCLFHIFSILCSSFLDYKNNDVSVLSFSNFLAFFRWWSFHASFISLINYLYLLVKKLKDDSENQKKDSYWEQVFNLITANANIISMFIFISSILSDIFFNTKLIPVSKKDPYFYWLYAIIWHIIAPTLSIIYFSKVDFSLVEKFREESTFHIFFHPLFYFLFVVIRSTISSDGRVKYPYPFFWIPMRNYSNFFVGIFFRFLFLSAFYLFFYFSSSLMLKLNREVKNKSLVNNNF